MSKSTSSNRFQYTSLTAADCARLNRDNNIAIMGGDVLFVLDDTPIIGRNITDEKGKIRVNKDGKPIRALYTIVVIRRKDATLAAGKATLSYLAGEDLLEESECPLLPCKDGIRKYAATWQCTKVSTRGYSLNLVAGDNSFEHGFALSAGDLIEGYQEPSLSAVWEQHRAADGSSYWTNKEGLGDSIKLSKVQRRRLDPCSEKLSTKEMENAQKLIKEALAYMGLAV